MRAVLYCRVSTQEQTKNLSLPTQEKACREYCARQGYDVERVFIDAGESAKSTDRPEFLRLLSYCREQKGSVHAVVVYSLTRFSRQQADHHAIMSLLRGLGISLRSVTEPIDDSPSGKLMEGILAAMAQFDNDVKSERVTAGMTAALERGRWVNRPPLGYLAGQRHGISLVPDPERAPIVREAFTLAANGLTGGALRARLLAMGLRSSRGLPVAWQTLYFMLRNRAYMGLLKTRRAADTRGDFEPLVDEDTFGRVQAQLDGAPTSTRSIARHRNHPTFPLRRFARCAACDRPLTGSASKGRSRRYAFYHCPKGCTRIAADVLEQAFLDVLDRLRPDPAYWALFRASVLNVWQSAKQQHQGTRASITRQIAALERQAEQLDQAFIYNRAIDEQTYHAQRDRLRERLAIARLELNDASEHLRTIDDDLDYAHRLFMGARQLWTDAASTARRLSMQWALFPAGIRIARGSIAPARDARFEPQIYAVSCLEFFQLGPAMIAAKEDGAPNPAILESVTAWLTHIRQLRALAEAA
jgi:DNA invertase Pin-like site-specific DNA recombinase